MTDDARHPHWHGSHRDAVAGYPSSDHVDMDTLTRHAAGQLPPARARMVEQHLLACEDGRCPEFVRAQAAEMGIASERPRAAREQVDAAEKDVDERGRLRSFQSREIVWSTFESMARELDVPIDDLVNEAMAAYARVRGYPVPDADDERATAAPPPMSEDRDPLEETHDAPSVSALDRSYAPPNTRGFDDDDLARTAARDAFVRPAAGRRPPPSDAPESRTTPQRKAPLPAALNRPVPLPPLSGSLPPPARPSRPGSPAMRSAGGGSAAPPVPSARGAAPGIRLPGARESNPPISPHAKPLVLSYEGRQYPVDKDRFLIGRSRTQSDLRLDDPNVSRQHAAIERVGAAWYVVDLGSTNGVHVAGERVSRRALSDGDLIVITTHEIRCQLR